MARGLSPEQMLKSEENLKKLCLICNSELVLLRKSPEDDGHVAEYLIRKNQIEEDFIEVR